MESKELLPGTLEMLILKTLSRGPNHGYGIAQHIQVGIGRRAQDRGGIALPGPAAPAGERLGAWRSGEFRRATARPVSTNSRRPGRKRLAEERRTFDAMILAIGRVMEA